MPRTDRVALANLVRRKVARIKVDRLLPMPHSFRKGRITEAEREEYRQRRDAYVAANPRYPDNFSRPDPDILDTGWNLLQWSVPIDPKRSREQRHSLVLLTALFFRGGLEKRRVSYNDVFDTLCRAYSDHFIASPAGIVRDMRPITAKRARRDLLLNSIDVNALWRFMVTTWPRKKKNRLYSIRRVKTGLAQYMEVTLGTGPTVKGFTDFMKGVGRDLYPSPGIRVQFVSADAVPRRARLQEPRSARCCADVPYNVVAVGKASQELLSIQSRSRLLFNIDNFNQDYERAQKRTQTLVATIKEKYGIDPEESDQIRRINSAGRSRKRQTRKGSRARGNDDKYWSPRDETLYHRSIESGLRKAKPPRGSRVWKMAKEKRERKPKEWQQRRTRFLKWQKQNGKLPASRRNPSIARLCEAATAAWSWRESVRAALAEYDRARQLVLTYGAVYEQVKGRSGIKPIRSDFIRLINRRYQPLHMWPSYVSAKTLDAAELDAVDEGNPVAEAEDGAENSMSSKARTHRHRWFQIADPVSNSPVKMVSRDISSSQTQIIATLLGIEELEQRAMASGTKVSFKAWLAELAFEKHKEGLKQKRERQAEKEERTGKRARKSRGRKSRKPKHIFSLRVVARPTRRLTNYSGKDDPRLQNLCKTLWMTASYGSELEKVHKLQSSDPDTYGPGWSGKDAGQFLSDINKRFPEMRAFLEACRYIANRIATRRPKAGVDWVDPSDRHRVRWNPVKRSEQTLSNNGQKLMLSLPASRNVGSRFSPSDEYPVDQERLRRMMAPCFVHMLDAYFSTLVMRNLARRGIKDFVGIHDCWYVSGRIKSRGRIYAGDQILDKAITSAAGEWYRGLGPVYGALAAHVKGNSKFETLIKRARRKWQKRRREGYVPQFLSKAE